jgi:GTP-binding protein
LIPGAHRGEGLGHRFLRHILRTRLLVHLLDLAAVADRDPLTDFDALNLELRRFDPALGERMQVVVGNKIDLAEGRANAARVAAELRARGIELHTLSAATGAGVAELVSLLCGALDRANGSLALRGAEPRP